MFLLGTVDKLPLIRSGALSTVLNASSKEEIRSQIYALNEKKEFVTLQLLSKVLREKAIVDVSTSTLWRTIRNLGFCYKKTDNRKVLCELSHIVAKRHEFLRRYVENSESKSPKAMVFLDETWIFARGAEKRSWQNSSIRCFQQPKKTGNGKRFMIIHAGGNMGFIPDAGKVLTSNKVSKDYHDTMDYQYFENWFENYVLKRLEGPSLIILDNAAYHTRRLNKTPNGSWRKAAIVTWLTSQNVLVTGNENKAILLIKTREITHNIQPIYAVDKIAAEYGHEVLRLPPYHCHFNPIELVWGVAKSYYDKEVGKISGNTESVFELWEKSLQQVPNDKWPDFVAHTDKIIKQAYLQEKVVDEVRPIIFSVNTGDSDEEEDFEEDFL